MKGMINIKINTFFRWYDIWVGFYIDKSKKTLYFCPLPMIGLKIDFRTIQEKNTEIVWKIMQHQANGMAHPLTCGVDSNHFNLVPTIEDDKVILKCIECDYKQDVSNWYSK